jgi:ribosome biogenesis protein NSA2
MERWRKLHGRRLDHEERTRKKAAREGHKASEDAQKLTGLRAKLYQKKRHHEKIQMKKQIKAHEERNVKSSAPNEPSSTPLPQYLLDRSIPTNAKALSSAIKNKRYVLEEIFIILFPTISFFRHGGILLEDWADPTLLERKKLQSSRFLCLRSAGLRKMRCSR